MHVDPDVDRHCRPPFRARMSPGASRYRAEQERGSGLKPGPHRVRSGLWAVACNCLSSRAAPLSRGSGGTARLLVCTPRSRERFEERSGGAIVAGPGQDRDPGVRHTRPARTYRRQAQLRGHGPVGRLQPRADARSLASADSSAPAHGKIAATASRASPANRHGLRPCRSWAGGKPGTIKRFDGSLRATDSGHPLDASVGDGAPGQAHGNNLSLNGGLWHEVPVQWSAAPQLQDRTVGRRCPSRGPARRDEEVSGGRCVSASWWIPVLPSAGGSGGLLGGKPTEPGHRQRLADEHRAAQRETPIQA